MTVPAEVTAEQGAHSGATRHAAQTKAQRLEADNVSTVPEHETSRAKHTRHSQPHQRRSRGILAISPRSTIAELIVNVIRANLGQLDIHRLLA